MATPQRRCRRTCHSIRSMWSRNITEWQVTESFQFEDVVTTKVRSGGFIASFYACSTLILRPCNIDHPSVVLLKQPQRKHRACTLRASCARPLYARDCFCVDSTSSGLFRCSSSKDCSRLHLQPVRQHLAPSNMLVPKPTTTATTIATKYSNRSGPARGERASCMCLASFGTSEYLRRARLRISHDLTVIVTADHCSVVVTSTLSTMVRAPCQGRRRDNHMQTR